MPPAGYADVQQKLREAIIWPRQYGYIARDIGVQWPRGIMLKGPAGVGKKLLLEVVLGNKFILCIAVG